MFGLGCVGQGLYEVLNKSTGFRADIERIVVKNPDKKRPVNPSLISYDKNDILNNPDIDVVVELIDDPQSAYEIVKTALMHGKHVVTANKKMLAHHFEELYQLQQKNGVSLLYEGSSCGSIPIIRTLEEYFDNEPIQSLEGIFNGTTNYILSKMTQDRIGYAEALRQAQELGFAESDPTNDVEGYDAKYKALIMCWHAFGLSVHPDQVLNLGIDLLGSEDMDYLREKELKLKLTPVVKRLGANNLVAFVLPQFVSKKNPIYYVEQEFNAVSLEARYSGQQFFQGRGAGSLPTGAAVLSDLSALSYGYKYEYKKYRQNEHLTFTNQASIKVYVRFRHSEEIKDLKFKEIEQSYSSPGYQYIIGRILLEELLVKRDSLHQKGIFLALSEGGSESIVLQQDLSVTKEMLVESMGAKESEFKMPS